MTRVIFACNYGGGARAYRVPEAAVIDELARGSAVNSPGDSYMELAARAPRPSPGLRPFSTEALPWPRSAGRERFLFVLQFSYIFISLRSPFRVTAGS